jgi:hypothetical protein
VKPKKLPLKSSTDKDGRLWAQVYTSEAEFARVFPPGEGYAELRFEDLFRTIDPDVRFAGIMLNGGADAFYPIPRELFGEVRRAIERATRKAANPATENPGA